MMQLQDAKQTKVLIVTLAETTPVLEAASLQADLRRAGIEPWAWIINTSIAAANAKSPLLRQRAAKRIARDQCGRHSSCSSLCRRSLLTEEPVGVERLLEMAAGNLLTRESNEPQLAQLPAVSRPLLTLWIFHGNSGRASVSALPSQLKSMH